MKIIFCLLSLFFSIVSIAQSNFNSDKPSVYLDSTKIELDYFIFDQNKILKVDVVKNSLASTTKNSGSIYITSKHPTFFNFLTYKEIKRKYFAYETKPVLLLLNGNFIKNPYKINIDSSYISKIEVETGADHQELKKLYPNFSIVNIKLKNINNINGEREIILQGAPPVE